MAIIVTASGLALADGAGRLLNVPGGPVLLKFLGCLQGGEFFFYIFKNS